MLWGCSSGLLREQGDLDRTGIAWHYMVAGRYISHAATHVISDNQLPSPCFVGNLWDVTDRDIDRLSEQVFKKLNLDLSHVPDKSSASTGLLPISAMSTVAAVNASRDACTLKYLTGAAPVVYGIPMYLH